MPTNKLTIINIRSWLLCNSTSYILYAIIEDFRFSHCSCVVQFSTVTTKYDAWERGHCNRHFGLANSPINDNVCNSAVCTSYLQDIMSGACIDRCSSVCARHTIVQLDGTSRKWMRIINGSGIPHECNVLRYTMSVWPYHCRISHCKTSFRFDKIRLFLVFLLFHALCPRTPTLTIHTYMSRVCIWCLTLNIENRILELECLVESHRCNGMQHKIYLRVYK